MRVAEPAQRRAHEARVGTAAGSERACAGCRSSRRTPAPVAAPRSAAGPPSDAGRCRTQRGKPSTSFDGAQLESATATAAARRSEEPSGVASRERRRADREAIPRSMRWRATESARGKTERAGRSQLDGWQVGRVRRAAGARCASAARIPRARMRSGWRYTRSWNEPRERRRSLGCTAVRTACLSTSASVETLWRAPFFLRHEVPHGAADQVHLRDRRRGLVAGQGPGLGVDRRAPGEPRPQGHDQEARSVPQRRSGHDEPDAARRGVRHRRRRRDRSRPRPLRALHLARRCRGSTTSPPARSTRP